MKKLIIYYVLIIVPLIILFIYKDNNELFVTSILIYALVYRPVIDSQRLISKGILQPKRWWIMYNPYSYVKWSRELYLL